MPVNCPWLGSAVVCCRQPPARGCSHTLAARTHGLRYRLGTAHSHAFLQAQAGPTRVWNALWSEMHFCHWCCDGIGSSHLRVNHGESFSWGEIYVVNKRPPNTTGVMKQKGLYIELYSPITPLISAWVVGCKWIKKIYFIMELNVSYQRVNNLSLPEGILL